MRNYNYIINEARYVSELFGYEEASFPIFERAEVFSRPLGVSSDVVSKETYTFEDRGGENITLRPEGTAGVMRSILSEGKINDLPLRLFYSGPMFRYERPQKGRLRQFVQIGIESIGNQGPLEDAEVIACGASLLQRLGFQQDCVLNINSLGDEESRALYRKSLVDYFSKNLDKLSPLSQSRLSMNPLRILDSKEPQDQEVIYKAPLFSSYLNNLSIDHFEKVKSFLNTSGIEYSHNEKLVRGLDYYSHTTFEFVTTKLGSQGTVLGGGRYDGLSEMLGGPSIPAVGFAAGVDRLVMLSSNLDETSGIISILPVEEENFTYCYNLLNIFRENDIKCEIFKGGNLSKNLKKISKKNRKLIIIVGDDEIQKKQVILKDLSSGKQQKIEKSDLLEKIKTSP
jgi:histidyl-tRNA synthetase